MEYRIKVIEKNNGYKEYIPQYFDVDSIPKYIYLALLFFPVTIICFVYNPMGLFSITWWKNIEYHKPYFRGFTEFNIAFNSGSAICSTREDALTIIAIHKGCKLQESESKKMKEESNKAQATKKVTYIKI